jgi:hypothetical protein
LRKLEIVLELLMGAQRRPKGIAKVIASNLSPNTVKELQGPDEFVTTGYRPLCSVKNHVA